MSKNEFFEGVGRRKTSIARVRVYTGKAVSTINGMPYNEYFKVDADAQSTLKPLNTVGLDGKAYFTAKVAGGGTTGQVEAIQLGIGRALYLMTPELKSELRKAGFVTRDPRMVERKKYHQLKARKKPQFSKR
ncbi:MAG: 30S ribosomal protein S9 [candidate division WS6 bacterium GW2011_GWF2_39_15]|uniref:30S ribosomal protein S9 n=1 Tax=candidate division WS6 bacterium GW2011_GWF2_39_15 TaxID=1619100 RepID=A0A0G0MNP5_9BACT|nr:MAG: 30S ribosomal protein S9 [candidate division WS6 bacterium GW2011_GWF2_39_15]